MSKKFFDSELKGVGMINRVWLVLCAAVVGGAAHAATVTVSNVRASQDTNTLEVTVVYDLKVEGETKNLPIVKVKLTDTGGVEIPTTWKGHVGAVGSATGHIAWWNPLSGGGKHCGGMAFATVSATLPDEDPVEMEMAAIPGFTKTYYRKWSGSNWEYSAHESFSGAETCSAGVEPFWMDVTEVTYAMWKKVVAWGESHGYDFTPSMYTSPYSKYGLDEHPVIYVGSGLATLWCNARSEMDGKVPLYYRDGKVFRKEASKYWKCNVIEPADRSTAGYRLPTCYEWSFAAHGGLSFIYPWGDDFNLEMMNCPYKQYSMGRHPYWGDIGYSPYTSPAGSFPANGYGLYDMVGNVWEICEAVCITADGNGLIVSPGMEKCIMGGSWDTYSDGCEDHAYSGLSEVEANAGFRSICLSQPSEVGTGSKSSAISNLFDITPGPEIIAWNVYGRDTEKPAGAIDMSGCADPYLVAGSNIVLRIDFNDYDRRIYSLQSIELIGTPLDKPAIRPIRYKWSNLECEADTIFLYDKKSSPAIVSGVGAHGPYSFAVSAVFDKCPMPKVSPAKIDKKVYFSKEGYDKGPRDPNWFVYWKEDGAVPALSSAAGYTPSSSWYDVATGAEFIDLVASGGADMWGEYYEKGNKIFLHRKAPNEHYWHERAIGPSFVAGNIQFCYQWEYGIYTVENVLAHETEHKITLMEYRRQCDSKRDDVIRDWIDSDYGFDGLQNEKFRWFGHEYLPYVPNTEGCKTKFCDFLTDKMELLYNLGKGKTYGFTLLTNKVDTFAIERKHPDYKFRGDNEFMSMLAGAIANADTHVDETKDWSYPGHQSYLPYGVVPRPAGHNEIRVQSMASQLSRSVLDSADSQQFSATNGTIASYVVRKGASGKVTAVDYEFRFEVTGQKNVEITGYLADSQSNIVAISSSMHLFTAVDNACSVRFDTADILMSGRQGPYSLFGVVMEDPETLGNPRLGAYYGFALTDVDLRREELSGRNAMLVGPSVRGVVTQDGLSVKLKLAVFEADKYDVAVDLLTTNGDFVASQEVSKECLAGTNQVQVLFSPDVLLDAGFDGPYVVKTVQLLRDGEWIDVCSDCLTTAAYKLSDFASAAFVSDEVMVSEGGTASVAICGGSSNGTASVNVYLTHLTTDASDLGMKFTSPLIVNWEKGEVGTKLVEIPIATDLTVEGDEFFVLQLADSQGQAVGSKSLCKVVVRDGNTHATLHDGAGYYKTKVVTSGDGLWAVSPGSFSEPDAETGLSHLVSPALRQGQTAELTFGPLDAGQFCYHIRFTGNVDAVNPSKVTVYVDDQYTCAYAHTTYSSSCVAVSDTWVYYYSKIKKDGSNVRFVFTQGSDPDSHAEICEVRWRVNADSVFGEVYALSRTAGGTVSGSGPYAIGDTATLKAAPLPGYRFAGWKKYDDNLQLVTYSESAITTVKVTGDFKLYAYFESIPYVAGLSLTGTGGSVTGSGYCADGQKAVLRAEAGTGYVLDGWYTNGVFATACTSVIVDRSARPGASTQTQCVIRDVTEDIVFYAKFVKPDAESEPVDIEGRYGPFVPGDKVELKFADGAAWKVAGLPAGLAWDAKLPGVTGVPTKPGTNTVYFTWTDKTVTPAVEHKASSMFIVGPLPTVTVVAVGETDGCKVTGGGAYLANKAVTLKATAAKGKAFAGWYESDPTGVGSGAPGGRALPVSQNPSYAFAMPAKDVTLYAKFVALTDDVAAVTLTLPEEMTNGVTVVNATVDVSGCSSLPTVKVTGMPAGLKFAAKDILKKGSKTEIEYAANTIYGTPTKSGVYTVVVTVTTAGKKTASCSQTVVVRKAGENVVKVEVPDLAGAAPGKVTGAGIYAAGKKVTLKAVANKGYVFAGWWDAVVEGGGEGGGHGVTALPAGEPVSRLASLVLTMPSNDVELTAAFITAEADKASIRAAMNGVPLVDWGGETSPLRETNVWAGVYLEWPVAASALSATTVKVSGLPAGLKFTDKPVTAKTTETVGGKKVTTVVTNVPANTIYGVPTAASKTTINKKTGEVTVTPSVVKVTVTTAGKSSQTYQIDLTVDPLPSWAVGSFDGAVACGQIIGAASMTVAASGKISGKYSLSGTNWAFSAAGYSGSSDHGQETNRLFCVDMVAKSGKQTADLHMEVSPGWITNQIAYRFPDVWIMTEDIAAYAEAQAMVWPYDPPLIACTQEVSRIGCSLATASDANGAEMVMHRNIWKDSEAPYLTPCKNVVADEEHYPDVKVSVSANGAVKCAGSLPDGTKVSSASTAYLVPGSEKPRFLLLVPTTKVYWGYLDELMCPCLEYVKIVFERWDVDR